jgi:hypothetical protein
MLSGRTVHWVTLGMALSILLLHVPAQAQTVAELQEKNGQLEAELQRLRAEYGTVLGLMGPAKKEIQAMAAVLAAKPGMAFDFSEQSGEMCFAPGHGDMIHYALDPDSTTEDVIYMLNAQPFVDNGLQVSNLPVMPLETGTMEPFQWYYYDGTSIEPHHGRQINSPYLIMAVDVQ